MNYFNLGKWSTSGSKGDMNYRAYIRVWKQVVETEMNSKASMSMGFDFFALHSPNIQYEIFGKVHNFDFNRRTKTARKFEKNSLGFQSSTNGKKCSIKICACFSFEPTHTPVLFINRASQKLKARKQIFTSARSQM